MPKRKEGALKSCFAFWSLALHLSISPLLAQSEVGFAPLGDESGSFQTEVLIADLDNPTGLALLPTQAKSGPYQLFLAESGAGRVIQVSTTALDKASNVIVDFPFGTFGQRPEYKVGPLSLAFISRSRLVVGCKGASPGADLLKCYSITLGGASISADKQDRAVGPLKKKITSNIDDLQFAGLVTTEKMLFATTGGRDSQGWLLKSGIEANRLAYLQPFVDFQKVAGFGGPAGIAMIPQPRPSFLVVALTGSRETPSDSRLSFFVPSNGELALDLPTGLNDIVSLAYSPTGQLYAADFSWQNEADGGVYRIDDARIEGQQTCRAVKVAAIVRPMSLAFAPNGSLFVTAFGEGENEKQGALIKITGAL